MTMVKGFATLKAAQRLQRHLGEHLRLSDGTYVGIRDGQLFGLRATRMTVTEARGAGLIASPTLEIYVR